MSNFMKKGLRQVKVNKDKKVKKHLKGFYRILGDINNIVPKLNPSIEYTEENIDEYVLPYLGRNLDSMEKFLILGKLHQTKINNNETKNNN